MISSDRFHDAPPRPVYSRSTTLGLYACSLLLAGCSVIQPSIPSGAETVVIGHRFEEPDTYYLNVYYCTEYIEANCIEGVSRYIEVSESDQDQHPAFTTYIVD